MVESPLFESPQVYMLRRQQVRSATLLRRRELGPFSAGTARLERRLDAECDALVLSLTVDVLTDRLPPVEVRESVTVLHVRPASWWGHFRLQYAARWWMRGLVRRRPVRLVEVPETVTVVVDLRETLLYPEARIAPQDPFGDFVRWVDLSKTVFRFERGTDA